MVTLPEPVLEAAAIRHAAGQCLKRVDLARRIRLLGVRVGSLVRARNLPAPQAESASVPDQELF